MRAISLMYDLSGGCDYEHTCGDCKYYEAVKKPEKGKRRNTSTWGKKDEGYCFRHPLRIPEWKPTYMACKWWKSPYKKTINKNKTGQCDGQLDLDMFL